MGKLPVNLIFVAEGDEERMDIGLRKFIGDHSDLFAEADALFVGGPSEGCVYVELTTSGKSWGRGPMQSDIHGVRKRTIDSVAWRHIQMLASLTSKDGNTPLIKGFFENKEPPTPADVAQMKAQAASMDLATMAKNVGVARFMWDDPLQVLKDGRFETSFNLDGDLGRQHVCGRRRRDPAEQDHVEAQLPLRAADERSRHRQEAARAARRERLQGRRDEADRRRAVVARILAGHRHLARAPEGRRAHDVDRSRRRRPRRRARAADVGAADRSRTRCSSDTAADPAGGYWPSYLFADGEVGQKVGSVSIPMGGRGGGGGGGGRAHAANEFYTVESIGKSGGLANAEKNAAAAIYQYAQLTTVTPKPKAAVGK